MSRTCNKCGDQELIVRSANVYRYGIEALSPLVKIEIEYICPSCGQKSGQQHVITENEVHRIGLVQRGATPIGEVKHQQAMLHHTSSDGLQHISVQFPAAFRAGDNILYPTSEGNVQDGTAIDQYGDPDLLLEFAEQYFKFYRLLMPTGRMPVSLIEVMPALHLLVVAAELGLKAYLIRNDQTDFGHSLEQLYQQLAAAHRNEIELRFSESVLNTNLTALGLQPPSVEAILQIYDKTYGGASSVYMDSRYYAEPTTKFRPSSGLHGANLVKSHNPYPIFFPEVVSMLIDTYRFFSGHQRLRRLGGDVRYRTREPGKDNHGDWGLVPSSLDLIVLNVSQPAGVSAKGNTMKAFSKLLSDNPPSFRTDWLYGGNTLLFYDGCKRDYIDGHGMLNGVECRVWRHKRLGMHARDLNLLADVIESKVELECLSDAPIISHGKS